MKRPWERRGGGMGRMLSGNGRSQSDTRGWEEMGGFQVLP